MTDTVPFSSIVVAGAGAWGTALALLLAESGKAVTLWTRNETVVNSVLATRMNDRYLPGVYLPETVKATTDRDCIETADAMLCVVPTQYLRTELQKLRAARTDQALPVALCCKGIEVSTAKFVHEILMEVWPEAGAAILSGPSFASDVAAGLPTAITLADKNRARAERWQETLSTPALRPYLCADLRGVALGGAVKNVLAIACGVVEGCGLGDSAKAALIARGFAEILRFAQAMNAHTDTVHGLSGLGDIILTCGSHQSRNFALGYEIGKGRSVTDIMKERTTVAEGAATAPILAKMATDVGADMPIANAVAALVSGTATAHETIALLLARPLKRER